MMYYLCYKTTFFSCLNEFQKYFPNQYNFFPRTFIIPHQICEFQHEHTMLLKKTLIPPTWVFKPKNSCCGKGIQIVQSVPDALKISEPAVAQIYVKPFLIGNKKFDFRFYLLIASLDPLTVFIYNEGIARFCSEDYEQPSKANRDKKFLHLTNTAINVQNKGVNAEEIYEKSIRSS